MEPAEAHAWLRPPTDTDCRDALAILRAFHVEDTQGLATLFANADALGALKGMISCFEMYLVLVAQVDTCDVVDSLLAGLNHPEGEAP